MQTGLSRHLQFLTSGHSDALTFSHERQSARVSKITNDGLAQSGTARMLYYVSIWQQWASKG